MKYVGKFNHAGEILTVYTEAISPAHAEKNLLVQLAKRLKVTIPYITMYFRGKSDRKSIKNIKKTP